MGEPIPQEYLLTSKQPGSIRTLEYTVSHPAHRTEDSVDKSALIYVPFGYDDDDADTLYNVLFLMHGRARSEKFLFEWQDGMLCNLLDNMIERGDIAPLIVVTPTYLKDPDIELTYTEEARLLRSFTGELRDDLLPALEKHYRVYPFSSDNDPSDSAGISNEEFRSVEERSQANHDTASLQARDHYAFGGFSFGAVETWYVFLSCLDLFKWYISMCGDCWVAGVYGSLNKSMQTTERLLRAVQHSGYSQYDFRIHVATGTLDPMHQSVDKLVRGMRSRPQMFTSDNLFYHVKHGGKHDYAEMVEYLYNILPLIFV